jgi:uncharacterized protein (DUF885 family)
MIFADIPITSPIEQHWHRESEKPALFEEKKDAHLYWEALVQIAKNDRESARELVSKIRTASKSEIASSFEWEKSHPSNIDDFFDRLFLATVTHNPQRLSGLGMFESIGIREHNAYLNNYSPAAIRQEFDETLANLPSLQAYDLDDLSPEQKISYKILSWNYQDLAENEPFLFHLYPITQLFGSIQELSMVLTLFHPVEMAEDVEHYLARLERIPEQFDQIIELLDHQKKQGIVAPRFALEKAALIIDKMIVENPEKHLFFKSLRDKLVKTNLPEQEKILARVKAAISSQVNPSYQKLGQSIRTLLETTTTNQGVWALPSGDAYYAHQLSHHTTTSLAAEEIHELGRREVERIKNEMRVLFAKEGLDDPQKNVGELLQELNQQERFYYPNTDEGRALCLRELENILERSRKELGPLFGLQPTSPVVVQEVPEEEAKGAPAAYYVHPSLDGSRPGAFYANLSNMDDFPIYRMETLVIHEGEPGHHFQISIQMEMDMPILRRLGEFNAHAEGWALYVEKLAYEEGFYSSSFQKLGHLQDELLRAIRLVVDTGIHWKRWSREEAIDYMTRETGYSENKIVTEIERYFVMPGQACSYKIGQLKILELRQKAKDRLGDKFDLKAFNDQVLKLGAVPLTLLEEEIDASLGT